MNTEELITSFGYWVRRRRKALDLTQVALAQRVGCALVTLKKIEWDERRPSPQMAERLADYLAISAAERDQFLRMARGEFVTVTLSPSAGVETRLFKHNLPSPATPFIGREKELTDIARCLKDPACRLLTLVGPGGIGKTRLAIQAAQHFVDAQPTELIFVHGIIFVPLTAVSSPSGIVSAIAEAANFTFYSNVPPQQQLLDYLREKEMFLLLDNFEHLLIPAEGENAGGVDLIAEILAVAPAVKLLVTSREALNLQEAWFHPIAGLAFPDLTPNPSPERETTPEEVEAYDAVRLFVQSARRARVGFSLAAEQKSVVRICQLVEGMPLGIELATAWLKTLSCDQIAREMERSLDILSVRLHNLPERHRSMRAVFEHSWRLLAEAEQAVLQRLSVFRGGFQQEAAEPVAGASLITLATLVEKSLLQVTTSGRYQMHELLRQFAGEKLAQRVDEETATRERHSHYYLDFLKAREKMLSGKEQPKALDDIGQEINNVRVGWNWVVEQGNLEAIAQVLESLYLYYQIRGRYREGQEIFAEAAAQLLQVAAPSEPAQLETVRRMLSARQGAFCFYLGDLDAAEALLQTSVTSTTPSSEAAFALGILGEVARMQGNPTLAQDHLRRSVALNRDIGNMSGVAKGLAWLAMLTINNFSQYTEAKQLAEESLAISRRLGRPDDIAQALDVLAWCAFCLGAYGEAEPYIKERHAIYQEIGDPLGIATSYFSLGSLAVCLNDTPTTKAVIHYEQAIAIYREIGHRSYLALCLGFLAHAYYELGQYDKALQFAHEGVTLAGEIGNLDHKSTCLCYLGAVEAALGEVQSSQGHLMEALKTAYAMQMPSVSPIALLYLGTLLMKEGDAAGVTQPVKLQKKAKALELFTLVRHHPATQQIFKDRAARLQAELEADLPREVVTAAQERGKTRQLVEVVALKLSTAISTQSKLGKLELRMYRYTFESSSILPYLLMVILDCL
jgi:predicted ATPase/transcriptional regulator with XRE-family HTH domain